MDAKRWKSLEWRWGSGTVTLSTNDDGFFTLHVEHAEAQDEFYMADSPEKVMDVVLAADAA